MHQTPVDKRPLHGPNTWTSTMENFSYFWLKISSIVQKFTHSIASCLALEIIVNSEKTYPILIWLQAYLSYKPRPQTSHAKN